MKIVFMGTPDFAVPCLQKLVDLGQDVVGVFTQPDKPKGRGHQMMEPPVKALALALGLPVHQPEKLRDGEALRILRQLAPDLVVVVAYGKILPEDLLGIPKLGCVNVHGSLLPKYRGAGPIQWSVIEGETVTGVTSMFMAQGMDTGDMILKLQTAVGQDETAGELYDRLCVLGADCLADTIRLFESGQPVPREVQNDADATYAPMLNKEIALLDFAKPAAVLHNLVRGTNPWPVAHTLLRGEPLKVYKARVANGFAGAVGEILDARRMIIGCGEGALELLEVQAQGAKRIAATDFMNGKRIQKGEQVGNAWMKDGQV